MFTLNITIGKRTLAWLLAGLLGATTILVANHADAGGNPPGEGIAQVYVAVGTNFPDALGVGPGAGANGAPIILVPTSPPLSAATEAELLRLDPREVVIIGGTSAVSQATEDDLVALMPNAVFSRIGGANRFITNAEFSESVFPIEGWVALPAVAFTTNSPSDSGSILPHFAFSSSDGELYAQIHLPNGAQILELRAEVQDGNSDGAVTVELNRYSNGIVTTLASVATDVVAAPGSVDLTTTTVSPGDETVDNETTAYLIEVTGAFGGSVNLAVNMVMVRYRLGVTG